MATKTARRKRKGNEWRVRKERPEEYLGSPELYYTDDEITRYSRSAGVRKAQEMIAERIDSFLGLGGKGTILDLGCGPGHTASWLVSQGYQVTGLDVLKKMLDRAAKKGIKTFQADMRCFSGKAKKESFDAVVSASALQWIKRKDEFASIAREIHSVLKKSGKCIIQFYPESSEEMKIALRAFKKQGFEGEARIFDPDDPRKRQVYLVLEKNQEKDKKILKRQKKPFQDNRQGD